MNLTEMAHQIAGIPYINPNPFLGSRLRSYDKLTFDTEALLKVSARNRRGMLASTIVKD
jgi:hypothetical protein